MNPLTNGGFTKVSFNLEGKNKAILLDRYSGLITSNTDIYLRDSATPFKGSKTTYYSVYYYSVKWGMVTSFTVESHFLILHPKLIYPDE